ncbi:MAG: ferrous iron transport protein B [Candidatus Limimorpha sp.]
MEKEGIMRLSDVPQGSRCVVKNVKGDGKLRLRLMELGFVENELVRVIRNAPLMDPVEYQVMDAHISLRRNEAEKIEVTILDDNTECPLNNVNNETNVGLTDIEIGVENRECDSKKKTDNKIINVALVGNPNCGKTSLFNHATGLREKVGNYSGVTVDAKIGVFNFNGYTIRLVDLPGTYSLTDYSAEEQYVSDYLLNGNPDLILNIVDASNIERNLLLTTQLLDIGRPMVIALNMYDELLSRGDSIDYETLASLLSLTIVPTKASSGKGIPDLLKAVVDVYECKDSQRLHLDTSGLDKDEATAYRYRFIRELLDKVYKSGDNVKRSKAYNADKILTNKWLGFPILVIFMWLMFEATFTIGAYPQEWIESATEWLCDLVGSWLNEGILRDLIVDGIIAGVGGVLVFLPNILILYFFIAILEDTGYMARAAFIMDKLMHKVGLHGKSFIPFIIGFGCSVPAVMSARMLENRKDRIVTILSVPFMSCSARLPVYLLFVSVFFDKYQGLILLGIYLIGILFAIITSLIMNKTAFKGLSQEFVMELPPYRIPTTRNVLIHMWDKSVQYLKKMGTIILAASIIIWALEYFPRNNSDVEMAENNIENSYIGKIGHAIEPIMRPCGFDWKLGVGLITGIAAKEVVVSTLGVLLDAEDEDASLKEKIRAIDDFTPVKAFGFMVFVLLCTPCIAALAAIKREAGLKWALFSAVYTTGLAWVVSCLIFQIGSLII